MFFVLEFFILSVIIGMKTKYKIKLTEDSKKKLATGKYRVKGLDRDWETNILPIISKTLIK